MSQWFDILKQVNHDHPEIVVGVKVTLHTYTNLVFCKVNSKRPYTPLIMTQLAEMSWNSLNNNGVYFLFTQGTGAKTIFSERYEINEFKIYNLLKHSKSLKYEKGKYLWGMLCFCFLLLFIPLGRQNLTWPFGRKINKYLRSLKSSEVNVIQNTILI